MNAPVAPVHFHARATAQAGSSLEQRLREHIDGDVLFDAFSRGRYSTDASIYQIDPVGVVVPRTQRGRLCRLPSKKAFPYCHAVRELRNAARPLAPPW